MRAWTIHHCYVYGRPGCRNKSVQLIYAISRTLWFPPNQEPFYVRTNWSDKKRSSAMFKTPHKAAKADTFMGTHGTLYWLAMAILKFSIVRVQTRRASSEFVPSSLFTLLEKQITIFGPLPRSFRDWQLMTALFQGVTLHTPELATYVRS